jgi:hypothetical protein
MNHLRSQRMDELIIRARQTIEKQLDEALYRFESEDPKEVYEDSEGHWTEHRLGPSELLQHISIAHDQLAILNEIQGYTADKAKNSSPTEEDYLSAMQKLMDKIGPANTEGE